MCGADFSFDPTADVADTSYSMPEIPEVVFSGFEETDEFDAEYDEDELLELDEDYIESDEDEIMDEDIADADDTAVDAEEDTFDADAEIESMLKEEQ